MERMKADMLGSFYVNQIIFTLQMKLWQYDESSGPNFDVHWCAT